MVEHTTQEEETPAGDTVEIHQVRHVAGLVCCFQLSYLMTQVCPLMPGQQTALSGLPLPCYCPATDILCPILSQSPVCLPAYCPSREVQEVVKKVAVVRRGRQGAAQRQQEEEEEEGEAGEDGAEEEEEEAGPSRRSVIPTSTIA